MTNNISPLLLTLHHRLMAHQQPSVTFSQYSDFVYIPKDEFQPKWYTQEEEERFQRTLILDARRMQRTLEESPSNYGTMTEHLYECLRIEKLILSRALIMRISKNVGPTLIQFLGTEGPEGAGYL